MDVEYADYVFYMYFICASNMDANKQLQYLIVRIGP